MKTSKIKLSAILISGVAICTTLIGCSTASAPAPSIPSATESTAQTDASSLLLQIEYYEGIIKDLEARLLNEKEANYIEIGEYKQTIAELEANIESLNQKIDIISQKDPQESHNSEFKEQVSVTPNTNINTNNQPASEFVCDGNIITKYKGSKSTIYIPERIDGTVITQIGEEAFKNSNIEKMILSDKIEYIDWFAFSGCKSLAEIYIPSSVTSIGYGAFDNCSSFLVIKCPKDSYAETFARSWGIIVITE